MDLFRLSNLELDSQIKTLAQKEREVLHEALLHIHEADRRRLYLQLTKYPSLFEYLTKGCGYSRGAAQRRIDAARLMTPVPEVAEKIESGELSLSQTSALQKAFREKSKTEKVSAEKKKKIVESLSHKSMPETQKIIAQELNLKLKESPKETHQKDESVRLELTFGKDQYAALVRARELLSTTSASNSWTEMFSYLAEKVIQKKTGQRFSTTVGLPLSTTAGVRPRHLLTSSNANANDRRTSNRKNISMEIKRKIFNRDQVCQFKNKPSGKICGSHWGLEIDHIQPLWANGSNEDQT